MNFSRLLAGALVAGRGRAGHAGAGRAARRRAGGDRSAGPRLPGAIRPTAAAKAACKSGELSTHDYYRQLLRLVYRLIFLFVAEDRDLLLAPDAGPRRAPALPRLLLAWAGCAAWPRRAAAARTPTCTASLRLVCATVAERLRGAGAARAGRLPLLPAATPNLDAADLANHDLLERDPRAGLHRGRAACAGPWTTATSDSEELGSVYEILLELHPQLNIDAGDLRRWQSAAGSERKTTGSYYTPTPLISNLLDSALEPVHRRRRLAQGEDARSAPNRSRRSSRSRSSTPPSGSGHFLIGAAHRLARHLARIRTGDEEPAPAALRAALRDVVRHCIYGVDINPMAVELCKVALWMETLDPGKPLSFLDRNIQCGNSLIGVDAGAGHRRDPRRRLPAGDRRRQGDGHGLRKRNKKERSGQGLPARDVAESCGDDAPPSWRAQMAEIETLAEDAVDEVAPRRKPMPDYLGLTGLPAHAG